MHPRFAHFNLSPGLPPMDAGPVSRPALQCPPHRPGTNPSGRWRMAGIGAGRAADPRSSRSGMPARLSASTGGSAEAPITAPVPPF